MREQTSRSVGMGVVEGVGRTVREFVRVLKGQIEENTGGHLETGDTIIQWIVRWAVAVASRYFVGRMGRRHARERGGRCRTPIAIMGEKVLYRT